MLRAHGIRDSQGEQAVRRRCTRVCTVLVPNLGNARDMCTVAVLILRSAPLIVVHHAAVGVQLETETGVEPRDRREEQGDREPLECLGRAGDRSGRRADSRGILEQGRDRADFLSGKDVLNVDRDTDRLLDPLAQQRHLGFGEAEVEEGDRRVDLPVQRGPRHLDAKVKQRSPSRRREHGNLSIVLVTIIYCYIGVV